MPKVYLLNKAGHDYSDAERYGELVTCTEGSLDKLDLQQMYRELSHAMQDSESCDFILLTSLTSLCCIACGIFSSKHGGLNLLIHTNSGYFERSVFFNNEYKDNNYESERTFNR
jgi:hypothetical protein